MEGYRIFGRLVLAVSCAAGALMLAATVGEILGLM